MHAPGTTPGIKLPSHDRTNPVARRPGSQRKVERALLILHRGEMKFVIIPGHPEGVREHLKIISLSISIGIAHPGYLGSLRNNQGCVRLSNKPERIMQTLCEELPFLTLGTIKKDLSTR